MGGFKILVPREDVIFLCMPSGFAIDCPSQTPLTRRETMGEGSGHVVISMAEPYCAL